jgi:hypothetical protein
MEKVAQNNRTRLCYLEQNADAKVHERLREVYHTLPGIVDRHGAHSQVSFLSEKLHGFSQEQAIHITLHHSFLNTFL